MQNLDRDTFINKAQLKDGAATLEPWEDFSGGIVGVTPDRQHVVYDYGPLVASLASAFLSKHEYVDEEEAEDAAMSWIDYDTIGGTFELPEEFRPYILFDHDDLPGYIPLEEIMV